MSQAINAFSADNFESMSSEGVSAKNSSATDKQFKAMIERAVNVHILVNESGAILYANPAVRRVLGYDPAELVGINFFTLVHEDHRPLFKGKCDPHMPGNTSDIGSLVATRNQQWCYLESICTFIADDSGAVIIDICARDVSGRTEVERKLLQQITCAKLEWERSMDSISDIVILVDNAGSIRRCNKALADLVGKPYKEILGIKWKDIFAHSELELKEHVHKQGKLLHKPTGRWFDLSSFDFRLDEGSNSDCTVIGLHDVTTIVLMTRELEKAYEELKTSHMKMLQQEKMASIGQLAAGIAHEINNPIGFVASNIGTLSKYAAKMAEYIQVLSEKLAFVTAPNLLTDLDQKRKSLKLDFILEDTDKLITESLDGTQRVIKIVQNLKSFSRLDEAEVKPADINACLESTINIVWNELKYKAALTRNFGILPLVNCYPQQLNQVFMNLLINAADSIEKQGEITVSTLIADGFINIIIADTGCGIRAEHLSRIFEPFFTMKEVGKGTGLGLSISYDIIKKHNGDMLVESEVGKGTTFTVRLPISGIA